LCSSNALSPVEAEKQCNNDPFGITPGPRAGITDLEVDGRLSVNQSQNVEKTFLSALCTTEEEVIFIHTDCIHAAG
jgi:hypothetical protein